ncbi:MAG: type III pantothenate kinase [Muribaculaceae bacterium]|nr:type III pantothenate kinase [Muribaculaceae bacterium]
MSILTIDKGNTATKIKVFTDSDKPIYVGSMPVADIDEIASVISEYDVTTGALCSVGHLDIRMVETLRRLLPGGLMLLTCDSYVPVKVKYDTPRTLGADRVAAACGAVALISDTPLLIADAGTALTLDYVDAGGTFLGGNISAGINLRLRSLHHFTAALPLVDSTGPLPDFGHDTDTALRCGAVRGVAAEIEASFRFWLRQNPDAKLVLTGGDSSLLLPLLPTETICHPDLVSLGLISILKHNEYL